MRAGRQSEIMGRMGSSRRLATKLLARIKHCVSLLVVLKIIALSPLTLLMFFKHFFFDGSVLDLRETYENLQLKLQTTDGFPIS